MGECHQLCSRLYPRFLLPGLDLRGKNVLGIFNIGEIAGVPTKDGTYTFTVRATDTQGLSDSQEFSITITTPSLTITTTSLPDGDCGFPYLIINPGQPSSPITLSASGGIPPYNWSLPTNFNRFPPLVQTPAPGLQLSPGGVISGTPSTEGVFPRSYSVRDASGVVATKSLSITIGVCIN